MNKYLIASIQILTAYFILFSLSWPLSLMLWSQGVPEGVMNFIFITNPNSIEFYSDQFVVGITIGIVLTGLNLYFYKIKKNKFSLALSGLCLVSLVVGLLISSLSGTTFM